MVLCGGGMALYLDHGDTYTISHLAYDLDLCTHIAPLLIS